MDFISDPVDLWSSANSKARAEKQYFDNTFEWVVFFVFHLVLFLSVYEDTVELL